MEENREEGDWVPRESLYEAQLALHILSEMVVRLRHEAHMDVLIPAMLNKRSIAAVVEHRTQRHNAFGLFMIDLNNFKRLNDSVGHARGDRLLINLGVTLHEEFKRQNDAIGLIKGRIGGDEFIVVADVDGGGRRTDDPHTQMDNVYDLIKSVEQRMFAENTDARTFDVGFAIGSAYFDPANPVSAITLMEQADEAMYEEKGDKAR